MNLTAVPLYFMQLSLVSSRYLFVFECWSYDVDVINRQSGEKFTSSNINTKLMMWIELENQSILDILIVTIRMLSILVGFGYVYHLLLGRRHVLGFSLLALTTVCSGIGLNILMTVVLITAPYSQDLRIPLNIMPISNVFVSFSIFLALSRYFSDSAFKMSTLWKVMILTFVFGTTLIVTVHAFQDSMNILYLRRDYHVYVFVQESLSEWFLNVCIFIPQYALVLICFLHLYVVKQQVEKPSTDVTCEVCHNIDSCYVFIFIHIGLMIFILRPLSHYSTLNKFSSFIYSNEFLINPPFVAICFMYVCHVCRDSKASHKETDLSTV